MKWLIAAWVCASPLFSATLSGIVLSENQQPISGAKVIAVHELAMLLVQQATSGRRGEYHFDLEPGPYRIIILKEGFRPLDAHAMVLSNEQELVLTHDLLVELSLSQKQPTQNLKRMLRRSNREPHKALAEEPLLDIGLMPMRDNSFAGTVKTFSRQDLRGELEQTSMVELETRINDQVQVHSSLTNRHRNAYHGGLLQMAAGVAFDLSYMSLGLKAETIQHHDSSDRDSSKALTLSSRYGRDLEQSSNLGVKQSDGRGEEQQEIALQQNLTYELLDTPVRQEVRLTNWDRGAATMARRAHILTDWSPEEKGRFGMRSDVDLLDFEGTRTTLTKLWVTGKHHSAEGRYTLRSSVGFAHDADEDQNLVQQHQLGIHLGSLRLTTEYRREANLMPFSSREIYGLYMPLPLTPYANESFYKNRDTETNMLLALDHGWGWNSRLGWSRLENDATLLFTHQEDTFRSNVHHRADTFAYSISSRRLGTRIEIKHSQNRNDEEAFDQTGVVYVQSLNPFRNKGLGVLLELHMKNNPDLPAWWMLENLPWDPREGNTWYEGHLSLQF